MFHNFEGIEVPHQAYYGELDQVKPRNVRKYTLIIGR